MEALTAFLPDESAAAALGARLAPLLAAGDVVCLSGPLGAGKTTLARGIIATLTGEKEAPSPTFALVESYDAPGFPLYHFDLYRLKEPGDVFELGVEEALDDGVSLIEWPEMIENIIPQSALFIRLETSGDGRRAHIVPRGRWCAQRSAFENLRAAVTKQASAAGSPAGADNKESAKRVRMTKSEKANSPARADVRAEFLERAGWARAGADTLAGDASTRSYERLSQGGKTALLMNAPPAAEGAPCPPEASEEERRRLGYNAMARLAGPNLNAFIAIAETLRRAGLSAPEIYAADAATGFALIEDLGDNLFARAIPAGAPETDLYEAAVDALIALRAAAPAAPATNQYRMLSYDRLAMSAETDLFAEWYVPYKSGVDLSPDLNADYQHAWDQTLALLAAPKTIILRDYHAENLLWNPLRDGLQRAGLIDFQDGLVGHNAYDLVSLLEDARRDVSPELAQTMIARYCAAASNFSDFNKEEFLREYAILGAQRNAKILGIFARLIKRDSKPRYKGFLPRVEAHFRRNLAHPDLARVRKIVAAAAPDLVS